MNLVSGPSLLRVGDGVAQAPDAADLFLADTRLRLVKIPRLADGGVNFIDVS